MVRGRTAGIPLHIKIHIVLESDGRSHSDIPGTRIDFLGLAESFGLAFIIGAYATGLALSGTKLAQVLAHHPKGVEDSDHKVDPPLVVLHDALVPHILRGARNAGGCDTFLAE